MVVVITCLDSSQPIQFPFLQHLQGIFNPLFQTEPLSIKFPDGGAVLLIGGLGFLSSTDMRRISVGVGVECLRDEASECTRSFADIIGNRSKRRESC